jgi:hypothetical protein
MTENFDPNVPSAETEARRAAEGAAARPRNDAASSRRKLLTRGLVGAPVLLTLASRPVTSLAHRTSMGERYCSYSGYQSGMASHVRVAACTGGHNVGYYAGNVSSWPKAGGKWLYDPDERARPHGHGDCFNYSHSMSGSGAPLFGSGIPNTLMNVLRGGSSEAHFVCALLNSHVVPDYPYKSADIIRYYHAPSLLAFNASVADIAEFFEQNLENI